MAMAMYPGQGSYPGRDFRQEMEAALRPQEDVLCSHVDLAALNEVTFQVELAAADRLPTGRATCKLFFYRSQAGVKLCMDRGCGSFPLTWNGEH